MIPSIGPLIAACAFVLFGSCATWSSCTAEGFGGAHLLFAFFGLTVVSMGGFSAFWLIRGALALRGVGLRALAAFPADPRARAKAVHDWVVANVQYDIAERDLILAKDPTPGHALPEAAAFFGRGVCSAMGRAVVRAARHAGLRARYVIVRKDCQGEEVAHACARIMFDDGTWVDSDPAYRSFGIRHQEVRGECGERLPT